MATPGEASQKLTQLKMTAEQPIVYYNNSYAAIHEAAFDLQPEEQYMMFVLDQCTESLPEHTAKRLNGKIVKKDSKIKTLRDAMDQAVIIDEESRQWVVMKRRRDSNNEIIIDATVNEISDIDVNYVSAKHGDNRLKSTMKNSYSPQGRQDRSFNNKTWSPRNNDNNFRWINKYKHSAREPRNNIKFEYYISRGEKEIMNTLTEMIEFLSGKSESVIEDVKRMPKFNPRGTNEVREDAIASITMSDLQNILKEDVNTIYDALVAADYIEEFDA